MNLRDVPGIAEQLRAQRQHERERMEAQLERLEFLSRRNVATVSDLSEIHRLRRRLAELDYADGAR